MGRIMDLDNLVLPDFKEGQLLAIPWPILDFCNKLATSLGTDQLGYENLRRIFAHANNEKDKLALNLLKTKTLWSPEKCASYYGVIIAVAKNFLLLRTKMQILRPAKNALDENFAKISNKLKLIREATKKNSLDDLDFGTYADNQEEREALKALQEVQQQYFVLASKL